MRAPDDAAAPLIADARNAQLRDSAGKEYIDLSMGYGSVWLGHNHPAVVQALAAQLSLYSAPGFLPSGALAGAQAAMRAVTPEGMFLGGIYSTGMEAVETALRAAWAHTGRLDIAGFEGSTHGRSFLTAAIGAGGERAPAFVHRLPGFAAGAPRLASELDTLARRVRLAAIVLEPVQMTGGGYELPGVFGAELFAVARRHGVAVVFDETLTGLYRCGARFYCDLVGQRPDILVLGKGIANGFPAAALLLARGMAWDRARVSPGSTFWNHPLACAAVTATLEELARQDAVAKVAAMEALIREILGRLELRGRGALWCLGFPEREKQALFARRLLEAGVVVSYYDRYIRLMPPLSIELDALSSACQVIAATYADTFS